MQHFQVSDFDGCKDQFGFDENQGSSSYAGRGNLSDYSKNHNYSEFMMNSVRGMIRWVAPVAVSPAIPEGEPARFLLVLPQRMILRPGAILPISTADP